MVNPYFYDLMIHWVKLVIFTFLASCLVINAVEGQQSNPFDIIITNSTKGQENTDSISVSDDIEYSDEDNVGLTPISPVGVADTTIIDAIANDRSQDISESNPFNIKKTTGKLPESNRDNKKSTDQIKPDPQPDIQLKSKDKTSWFAKLRPKRSQTQGANYSLNFIFWILIASLLILAVVINLKRKSFLNLYRAITNDNYLKLLQREEYNGSSFFFLLLYFLFFLNMALFLYQVLINKFEINGYKVFLFLFAALLVLYLVRLISTFVLQITFPLEKEAKQYNFTIIMFNIIIGLLLIPVNILIAYAPFGPKMIYVGLGIIALFYLLRQIRGLFIAARIKGLSYFHFFIYLCTFEVAPIFWIISIVNNWYSVS